MPITVELFDGSRIEFPDNTDRETIERVARQKTRELQGIKPEGGFIPAVKAGAVELGGGIQALLGRAGITDPVEAERAYRAAKERAAEIFKPTEEGWSEAPWTKFKETLGGSLPYMAAPVAAAGAAALAPVTGAAATALGLGAAGLTSAGQFTATNLARQMDEGKRLQETDLAAAAAAAVPQALLDTIALRMMPGVGRIFGQAGVKVTKENAEAIAKQALSTTLKDYAVSTGGAMTREGVTEAAQQALERLQAGLSITDPAARAEYFESFVGGAVLGGAISPAGRFFERSGEQRQARGILQEEASRVAQEQRAAEEARKQTPEYLFALETRYKEAKANKEALDADAKKPGKGATPEQQSAYAEAKKARDEFARSEFAPIAKEYQSRKQEIDALNEQRAQAAEIAAAQTVPQEAQTQPFYESPQGTLPGMEAVEAPAAPTVEEPVDYKAIVAKLNAYLDDLRTKAQTTVDLDEKLKLGEAYAQAQKALKEAEEKAKQAPGEDNRERLLRKKMAVAEEEGDVAVQAALAKQLKELGVTDLRTAQPELPGMQTDFFDTKAAQQRRNADYEAQAQATMATRPDMAPATEERDPLALWKASLAQDEEQTKEELLRPDFSTIAPSGAPSVAVPDYIKPAQKPDVTINRVNELIAARDQADKDKEAAYGAGNRELGVKKAQELEAAQSALSRLEQSDGTARALIALRKAQDTALMEAAQLTADLRAGRTLGGPEKGTASSTPQTLISRINKTRDTFIQAAVQEAAITRRLYAKGLPQDEATTAAKEMRKVFDEWVTRSMAQPVKDVDWVNQLTAQFDAQSEAEAKTVDIFERPWVKAMRDQFVKARMSEELVKRLGRQRMAEIQKGTAELKGAETQLPPDTARAVQAKASADFNKYVIAARKKAIAQFADPRPLEERQFGAYRAAAAVLDDQLRGIANKLKSVLREFSREEALLRRQTAASEAAKVAEAKGETAKTQEGALRRQREYVGDLIDRAFQTRRVPGIAQMLLTRTKDFLEQGRGTGGLLDIAEDVASRVLRGQNIERSDLVKLRDEVRAESNRPGEGEVVGEREKQRELFTAEERRALAPKVEGGALGVIRQKPEVFEAVREKEAAKFKRAKEAAEKSEQLTKRIRAELARIDEERIATLEERVEERASARQSAWQSAVKKAKALVVQARKLEQKPKINALKKEIDAIRKAGVQGLNKETIDKLLAAREELDKINAAINEAVEAAEFIPIAQANKWVEFETTALKEAQAALAANSTPATQAAVKAQQDALLRAQQAQAQNLKGEERAAAMARMRAAQTGLGLPGLKRVAGRVEEIKPAQTAEQRAAEAKERFERAREEAAERVEAKEKRRNALEQRALELSSDIETLEAAKLRAKTAESKAQKQTEIAEKQKELTIVRGQLEASDVVKPRKKGPATVVSGAGIAKKRPLRTGYRKALEAASEGIQREREQPTVIEGTFEFGPQEKLFSRGPTAEPSTVASLRAELGKVFPDLGRVQMYESVEALIKANPQYEGKVPSDARGFVDSAGNKVFLIAENIDKGNALSVLLHEVGSHVGLKNMLGSAQYNALVKAVEAWEKRNDGSVESRVARAARAKVEAAETEAAHVDDELLAYAIEEAVNAGVKPFETKSPLGQWLSRIAQAFRKVLEKFGLPPKALDAQALVDMAFGAAEMEMRPVVPQMSREVGELFFTYAGEKSGVAPDALRKAKDMQIKGAEPEKIWSETGWFQAPDKKWRYEIDDSKAKFNIVDLIQKHNIIKDAEYKTTLDAVMQHPELYKLYPSLKDIEVTLYNKPNSSTLGSFNHAKKQLKINVGKASDFENTLLHEVQHYIQGEESFTSGSSPEAQYLVAYTEKVLQSVRETYVRKAKENPNIEDYYLARVKAIDAGTAAAKNERKTYITNVWNARKTWRKAQKDADATLDALEAEYKKREEAERAAFKDYMDALKEGKDYAALKAVYNNAKNNTFDFSDYMKQRQNIHDELRKAQKVFLDIKYGTKNNIKKVVEKALKAALPANNSFAKFAGLYISEDAYQNVLGEVEARDVAERQKLAAEERATTRPYTSQPQTAGEILFSRAVAQKFPVSSRVIDATVAAQRTWKDDFKDNLLNFRTQFLDKLFPAEQALKLGGVAQKAATQALYYLRMYDYRMHMTSQAAFNGAPDLVEKTRKDGTKEFLIEAKEGANISKAVKVISTKEVKEAAGSADNASRMLTMYMAALRGERVGYEKLNFGRAFAEAEIKRLTSMLQSLSLTQEARSNLQKKRKQLEARLDTLPTEADFKAIIQEVQGNDVLRKAFDEARDIYNQYNRNLLNFVAKTGAISRAKADEWIAQGDYIPYYRMENGVAELVIGNETPIRIGNLKDSPHLEKLVGGDEPIMNFLDSSVQNTAMLIEMGMHNLAMRNLMFELQHVGLAKISKETKRTSAPEGAVTFKMDGNDHFAIVDTDAIGVDSELLVKGLAGIPTMLPGVTRLMGIPARILRKMVLASPVYWGRQLVRDSTAAALASGADMLPVIGALKKIGKYNELEARGITGGQVFTGMPEDMADIMRGMQRGKISLSGGLAWLESQSAKADALTRKAQYDSYIEQGMSEVEATLMAMESMNFARRGLSPSLHMLSTVIPFFNAQIQGLDVLYRSFRGQMPMNEQLDIRRKLIARGMMLFGMSMMYAFLMQDDEAYKNAKPEEKYGNWFVPLPGTDQKLRVPIPFELGYIFKALPEAIVNSMASEEGAEDAIKAFTHIFQQTIPGGSSFMLPQAVKPGLEALIGTSLYTGRGIESGREQQIEAGYRVRESTTEAAAWLGETFGFSPIKLEFLIRGYTAGVGMAFLQALSLPMSRTGPEPAEKRPSDLPVVGTLFQPSDASGIIDATYERMQELAQKEDTYKRLLKEGRTEAAAEYLEKNAGLVGYESMAGRFRQQMGKITDYERQIRSSTLSPQEKRQRLEEMRDAKIRLASAYREAGKTARQASQP